MTTPAAPPKATRCPACNLLATGGTARSCPECGGPICILCLFADLAPACGHAWEPLAPLTEAQSEKVVPIHRARGGRHSSLGSPRPQSVAILSEPVAPSPAAALQIPPHVPWDGLLMALKDIVEALGAALGGTRGPDALRIIAYRAAQIAWHVHESELHDTAKEVEHAALYAETLVFRDGGPAPAPVARAERGGPRSLPEALPLVLLAEVGLRLGGFARNLARRRRDPRIGATAPVAGEAWSDSRSDAALQGILDDLLQWLEALGRCGDPAQDGP